MNHSEDETSGIRVPGLYPWPYDGKLDSSNTGVIVLGMQGDYAMAGGLLAAQGSDVSMIQALVPGIAAFTAQMRQAGFPVVFVRESHRTDLRDLPKNKHWRSKQAGAEIGAQGPLGRYLVRGETGTQILPGIGAASHDDIVDTSGKSGFFASDLDQILRQRGLSKLLLIGATTDGLVQATLRDANDKGYECLVLQDLCATIDPAIHAEQITMLALANGLWGSVATSGDLIQTLARGAA